MEANQTTKEHVSPPFPGLVLEMTWSHASLSNGSVGSSASRIARNTSLWFGLRLCGASYNLAWTQIGQFLDLGRWVKQCSGDSAISANPSSVAPSSCGPSGALEWSTDTTGVSPPRRGTRRAGEGRDARKTGNKLGRNAKHRNMVFDTMSIQTGAIHIKRQMRGGWNQERNTVGRPHEREPVVAELANAQSHGALGQHINVLQPSKVIRPTPNGSRTVL